MRKLGQATITHLVSMKTKRCLVILFESNYEGNELGRPVFIDKFNIKNQPVIRIVIFSWKCWQ